MGFVKLSSGILDSSIWNEPIPTRVVWIAFLAKADQFGFVASSASGMLRASNIPQEDFDKAVAALESPDQDSRTSAFEGRRIEKREGGWQVLNYEKYREFTYSSSPDAVRMRLARAEGEDDLLFPEFWNIYPKKQGREAARIAWLKIPSIKNEWPKIQDALAWQVKSADWTKEGGEYIPAPAKYLSEKRWMDEPRAEKKYSTNGMGF
jgi:hypothetical protein